jgi:hypothetical protein
MAKSTRKGKKLSNLKGKKGAGLRADSVRGGQRRRIASSPLKSTYK